MANPYEGPITRSRAKLLLRISPPREQSAASQTPAIKGETTERKPPVADEKPEGTPPRTQVTLFPAPKDKTPDCILPSVEERAEWALLAANGEQSPLNSTIKSDTPDTYDTPVPESSPSVKSETPSAVEECDAPTDDARLEDTTSNSDINTNDGTSSRSVAETTRSSPPPPEPDPNILPMNRRRAYNVSPIQLSCVAGSPQTRLSSRLPSPPSTSHPTNTTTIPQLVKRRDDGTEVYIAAEDIDPDPISIDPLLMDLTLPINAEVTFIFDDDVRLVVDAHIKPDRSMLILRGHTVREIRLWTMIKERYTGGESPNWVPTFCD
ncbi:uncharacterized protein IWZ02DRAFT_434763 [Phyllosticta citriasiana]|uniref:uncharacterized protein n=1 Tax=Phyllosticta citriasiana TaxID=595635 RepID=UPI0030FD6C78